MVAEAKWVRWRGVNEEGYWWWDNEDSPHAIPVEIVNTLAGLVAVTNQHGWNRRQCLYEMGGWWMRLVAPELREAGKRWEGERG